MKRYTFTTLALLTLFTLSCGTKAFVQKDVLLNVRKIALVQCKMNSACLTEKDRMKYLNTELYAEVFCTNFVNVFNASSNAYNKRIVFLADALPAETYTALKGFTTRNATNVVAEGTIDLAQYTSNEVVDLTGQLAEDVEAYMVITLTYSLWAQSVVYDIAVYPKGAYGEEAVIWQDSVKAVSTYIMNDKESPYSSESELFRLEDVERYDNKATHQEELYYVIEEAVSNAAIATANRHFKALDPEE